MKLLLASQAPRLDFPGLFSKPLQELQIAVIPTASTIYDERPWFYDTLRPFQEAGCTLRTVELEGQNAEGLRTALKGVDAIFVGGGNTFHLCYHAQQSGFFDVVKEKIAKDVLYIGSSAGCILACPTVEYTRRYDDESVVPITSYEGMGLIDYCIIPHYDNKEYTSTIQAMLEDWRGTPLRFLALRDGQALWVQDALMEVI